LRIACATINTNYTDILNILLAQTACADIMMQSHFIYKSTVNMKLTKSLIDRSTFKGQGRAAYIIWDDDISGFGIRIYPSGKKVFIIGYRFDGKYRQLTIGTYGVFTLDQARLEARKLLVSADTGIDPAGERVKQKSGSTIKHLCITYLERHAKIHNKLKSWKEDERRMKARIIPAFGKKEILTLTRGDISKFHESLGKKYPYEANRTRALLSSMFERAREWELIPQNHPNPALNVKRFKEKKRERWVKHGEMPLLIESILQESNVYIRACFFLYLLTGVRKVELLHAKWADVDFERKKLRLDDTKNSNCFEVTLSDPAVALLRELPRMEGNPYIIPGKKEGSHWVNVNIPWKRIRTRAGLDDVRIHDLRRTFASWLATQGTPLLHIGKLLNHKNSATTEVYAHLNSDPLSQEVETVGNKLKQIIDKSESEIKSKSELSHTDYVI
jgi:integrase